MFACAHEFRSRVKPENDKYLWFVHFTPLNSHLPPALLLSIRGGHPIRQAMGNSSYKPRNLAFYRCGRIAYAHIITEIIGFVGLTWCLPFSGVYVG
jgi:hypothetical protein